MSDALPRAEHPRPPGWTPPVHPPPAPVAAAPAAKPSASVSASAPAASPTNAASGDSDFGWLAGLLAIHGLERVMRVLLFAETPVGIVQAGTRMVEVGLVALTAAVAVGLFRKERWVGRAAIFWAASLLLLRILQEIENPTFYSDPGWFWSRLIGVIIYGTVVVIDARKASRGPAPAPSPSP